MKYVFKRVKNCTCWAKQGSNECIDPQFKCGEIYHGDCAVEKPSDDYVPTGLKCLSLKLDIFFILLLSK